MKPDHLAVSAGVLSEGVSYLEGLLGVPLEQGGEHPHMGTHNQLLSLGPDLYLEVIAIDPGAQAPKRARWFDLDNFSGGPRLSNWIVQTDDMQAGVAALPEQAWEVMNLQRADLRWRMAVPKDGCLPFDGMFPALIAWQGPDHPARMLPERGCRLRRLSIIHPRAEALIKELPDALNLDQVEISAGNAPGLRAEIETPFGLKVLV